MDAQQFLAAFGHIANAPGGIGKLRELVLQLAISGRLTERIVDETNALDLIDINRNRQKTLIEQKVLKRQPTPRPVTASDQPWMLPEGWAWTRLGSVTNYGDAPKIEFKNVKEGTWVLELEDVEKGTSKLLSKVFARERKFKSTKNGFPSGAVLYGKLRPYLNKVLIADSPGVCTTEISPISFFENINAGYLRWYLKSPYFIAYADGSTYGMNLPRLSTDSAREALFAFPPLKEQARIVAKVDELMALCDKLEAQQQARRELKNKLRQSILQAVASATSPHELQSAWTRLADNFGRLVHSPENVRMLRDVIFYLALKGALLPDSAASITDEAARLPQGWNWRTLAELSAYITSGSRGWKSYISSKGDSFIRSQDIKHDVLIFESPAFVLLPERAEGKRTLVRQGDLLLTITGGNVGKCATVPALSQDAYVSQHVALIRLHEPWMAGFIHFWMINAFGGRDFLSRFIYGDKPGLNLKQVGSVPIPVPTQSACNEILRRLRIYQAICEKLEKQLRAKSEAAEALALTAVSSLTGIAIQQDEDPISAPQTDQKVIP